MKIGYVILTMLFFFVLFIGGSNMAEYNIQMEKRNAANTEWDKHFPVTKSENVLTADGSNVGDKINQFTERIAPIKNGFGMQLENLKYSLSNPLEQYTGIVFVGDSITWGMTLVENPANYNTGRDGSLSDIRDVFASPSFVNNLKRYIGEKYAPNTTPIQSNWAASPQGEAVTTYEKEIKLYPDGGDFTNSTSGSVLYSASRSSNESLMGHQLVATIESASNGESVISFPFTGDAFTLSFDSVNESSMDYELFVDGVSRGVFNTKPGGGIISGYDQRRTHTFPYVRNKTIQIKSRKVAYVGNQSLYIGGIIVNKKIRITNQGIIGTTAKYYKERNMSGNTNGDGTAVGVYDNYVFIQLGANDRLTDVINYPKGSNEFKGKLRALVDEVKNSSNVVLMVSNPVFNENPETYSFTMLDARNVIYSLAKENNIDFIDNYLLFGSSNVDTFTVDGLHPNKEGHQLISRNIINSIEFN